MNRSRLLIFQVLINGSCMPIIFIMFVNYIRSGFYFIIFIIGRTIPLSSLDPAGVD